VATDHFRAIKIGYDRLATGDGEKWRSCILQILPSMLWNELTTVLTASPVYRQAQ